MSLLDDALGTEKKHPVSHHTGNGTSLLDAVSGAVPHMRKGSANLADPLKQAAGVLKDFAFKKLEAIDAVLGAPERMVEGTVAHGGDIGHGFYETFHPRDTQTRDANLANVEKQFGVGGTKGIEKAGVDFGTQTLLDPLSYIPFLGGGRWLERGAVRLADAIPTAVRDHPHVQQIKNFFKANPALDEHLSKNGKNVYLGVYASERSKMAREMQKDSRLLEREKKTLKQEQPSEAYTRRLDELAYVHGDEDMRRQVLQRGVFKPTAEQAAKPPTGFLPHFDLLEDYFPKFEAKALAEQTPFLFKKRTGEAATPYTKHRVKDNMNPLSDPYERAQKRLALAQARIFEQSVDHRLAQELGEANDDYNAIQGLRHEGLGLGQEHVTSFSPLRGLSNAYRQALFINPLPHMFNIARLTYLAGGASTVSRGLKYAVRGAPEHIAQETAEKVGSPLYLSGKGGLLDVVPGVNKLRDLGQGALTNFDRAMREAYLAELMRGGKPATYEMGQTVRSGIGDYDRASRAVQIAQAAGAPFAHWQLGVVPGAVGRATLRNPERTERYARGMIDTKNNTLPFEFSGPVEDFGRLVSAPYGTARYIMSPSAIGPVLSQLHNLAGLSGSPDTRKIAEQLLRSYVPGGGIIEEAFGLSPYKESDQRVLNVLLSLLGGYTTEPGK